MDNIEFEHNTWGLIHNYLDNNSNYLTKHHLDSFNDFILTKIPLTFSRKQEVMSRPPVANIKSFFVHRGLNLSPLTFQNFLLPP